MPRWGEGAVVGTNQDRQKRNQRRIVGAGAAGGGALGGVGTAMMVSGKRTANRETGRAGRITSQMVRESQERNARAAQMRGPRHIARQEAGMIDRLNQRPAVQQANRAAAAVAEAPAGRARNLAVGRLTQRLRSPDYDAARQQGAIHRMNIDANMAQIKPLQQANEYSELKSRAMRATRARAQGRAAAGVRRFGRGRALAVGAAALPLAALAGAKPMSSAWTSGNRTAPPPGRDNYQSSKPQTHGMNRAQRAAAERGDWDAYAAARRRNGL